MAGVVEFDEKIRQSKIDAEDALHRIPEIERKIAEAEDKTYAARTNLADAENDANEAKRLAEEARDLADMAATVSHLSYLQAVHRSYFYLVFLAPVLVFSFP